MLTKEPKADLETRGMAFLARARRVRGLSAQQVARIEQRLFAPATSHRRLLIPALVGVVLILSAGGALAWVTGTLHRLPGVGPLLPARRQAPAAAPLLPPTTAPRAPSPAAAPAALPSSVAAPAVVAERAQLPVRTTRRAPAPSKASQPERVAPTGPSVSETAPGESAPAPVLAERPENPLVAEGKSFAAVLSVWHQNGDGKAALTALNAHDRRFPAGQMKLEARLLRAEILLAEHRESEALAILDGVSLGSVPRSRELRTLRGELRIKAGRCEDGRSDLDPIARGTDTLAQRAQQALSYCR